uniref:Alpha-1,4-N-acetylglucosaminyltransferase n=1 Tax=Biomphalaria glabrata TaxID=6526 RepID=A0A2C9KU59_BIOGL
MHENANPTVIYCISRCHFNAQKGLGHSAQCTPTTPLASSTPPISRNLPPMGTSAPVELLYRIVVTMVNAFKQNSINIIFANRQAFKFLFSGACPLAEFLAVIDETFWKFGAEALCENGTDEIDILCLVYLRQLGISRQLERGACALDSKGLVPKIVYFVTLGAYTFHMWNYIAVVAAYRHVQPVALYIVGDRHPQGEWWERVRRDVPGLRFVFREKPSSIAGRPAKFVEHLSDLVRMQLLYMNGGIYLDLDMVVLRSLEPLLGKLSLILIWWFQED